MSFILSSIIEFFTNKITKLDSNRSEFNPKLAKLKLIKISSTEENERKKLFPSEEGLLLNENKTTLEKLDINDDSCYNKLETKNNSIILHPIYNCFNNYKNNYPYNFKQFSDYISNFIPSNKISFNYISNYLLGRKDVNNLKNYSFSFNCTGNLMAFINQNNDLVISNLNIFSCFKIQSNFIFKGGITSFNWDKVHPNKIFVSDSENLYECLINEKEFKFLLNKTYSILSYYKFINCIPSPRGDLIILLYQNGMEVYDNNQCLLLSKQFNTKKFKNGIFDYKSSVFIAYTENELIIFNTQTFDFKVYSYFNGRIIKVINNFGNDNIYIFVVDKYENKNELFLYTLIDSSIISDIQINFNNYQNSDIFYKQNFYVLKPEIYVFQHKEFVSKSIVIDVGLSENDCRVAILYKEDNNNNITLNSLYIFALMKDIKDNNNITKVIPLYNFGHVQGSQINSFGFNKMIDRENSILVVRFDDDNFIKTEPIKG